MQFVIILNIHKLYDPAIPVLPCDFLGEMKMFYALIAMVVTQEYTFAKF